jgi:hypothetical protein
MNRLFLILCTLVVFAAAPAAGVSRAPLPLQRSENKEDPKLRDQVKRLAEALNKRDLNVIRSLIAPSRIYVEVAGKEGAYLSKSQTLVVMESFLRTRSSLNAIFDFVSDDGAAGSASGFLSARKDGKLVRYRLSFGFVKTARAEWYLNRITMR